MPKFRVTGSNKETGARMTLELAASSKGDAERKATQSGMNVNHAAPIADTTVEETPSMALKNYRDEPGANRQKVLLIVFGVLLLIALIIYFGLGWRPW